MHLTSKWMASVDLKDAFYFVPVKIEHQKFLKFIWDMPYYYTATANGYANATIPIAAKVGISTRCTRR